MANPHYGEQQAAMFYCGDDDQAKSVVRQLAEDLDLEPIDSGPMKNAGYLESLAMLYIHLAIFGGWGADCAVSICQALNRLRRFRSLDLFEQFEIADANQGQALVVDRQILLAIDRQQQMVAAQAEIFNTGGGKSGSWRIA